MKWRVQGDPLGGRVSVPGDKSIAHRALLVAAVAAGDSRIGNFPGGQDVLSTAHCLQDLGVRIKVGSSDRVGVIPPPVLEAPGRTLAAGNSGTTMRLLCGLLAGQDFCSSIDGDASLQNRPMDRVIEPLQLMGASIRSNGGRALLEIHGSRLHGVDYTLPLASAQVKSAVLLAGLTADGATRVREPIPTRDHTERMLRAAGVDVTSEDGSISLEPGKPQALNLRLPGDFSSAAFFLAAAAAVGGQIVVENVGLNPTRTGLVQILRRMGACVETLQTGEEAGEPVGGIRVSGMVTSPVNLGKADVPAVIDELPLVALLATQVAGETIVRGAAELRVKETNRIQQVVSSLSAMGADIRELSDGFVVRGPTTMRGAEVSSGGDHRLALMLAVAASMATGETVIDQAQAATVSYPRFAEDFARLGGTIAEE